MDSNKRKPKPIPNERLRYYRKMRFWSQSDLADQLYSMCSEGEESERGIISTNMVSRWELGEIPSSFWRKKLCELFGQDSVELGFLKPPEQPVPVPARASVDEQIPGEQSSTSSVALRRSSPRHSSVPWREPTPHEAIDRLCEHPDAPPEDLVGEWLALSGNHLVHLLANGWTIDAILETLRIVLKVVQAMPMISQSFSRRELFKQVLQLSAAAVVSTIPLPEGRHASAEDLTQLHQALSESIIDGWKLFVSASNAQVLALGQAQLSLVQQVDSLLYPSVRPFLYTGVYGLIGIALHFQERDVEALRAHRSGYITALATGEPWYVAQSLICQSDCHHALGQYSAAIQAIEEALRIIGNPTDKAQVCARAHLLTCWADNAMMLENYKTAQEKLETAGEYLDQIVPNEEFDRASWLMLAGKYALLTKDYTTALSSFKESLAELPEQWTLRRAMTTIGLTKAYARLNERDQSLSVAEDLIPMVQTVNAQMTNRWFTEYLQQDLLGVFPTDRRVRKFVTDTYKVLPQLASIPVNSK